MQITTSRWIPQLKTILKPWIPKQVLSFYRQFREPLHLPDRSEVVLFADSQTLPEYTPRYDFSMDVSYDKIEPVTLISTVYNEAKNVTRWLESLRSQRRLPDEIVITDGGSTDGTLEILQRYFDDFPVPLKVISEPGANIARGRNLAIMAASHELIACSDCGSLLDENWLHALTLPFALDPQMGVSAGYYDVLETNTLSCLARRFFGVNLKKIDPQEFLPSGRSLAFRKRLWANAGGYPEWLTDAGEDTLFDLRLKAQPARWAFVPAAQVAWYAPETLRKLLRTYYRYSRGDGETGIAAELYWYKVVELVRIWPRRIVMFLVGLMLTSFWPWSGTLYFSVWCAWSLWRLWIDNRPHAQKLGRKFYPFTLVLEIVGTVQAFAFTLGVMTRSKVRARETVYYRGRLKQILAQHPERRGVIVYPPTHDWGFMFQRPHQIARAFAKQGWLYFFCSANLRTDAIYGLREFEPGLYLTHIPEESFGVLDNPIVYLGSAWNRSWLKYFNDPIVIYDHYDDLIVSGASQNDHQALLQNAEIVVVTARRLWNAVKPQRKDALLIPNGVDIDFIQSARPDENTPPPEDLLPILELAQPIVGYSGALAEWFDYALLARLARDYAELSFVLVGVDYDGSLNRSGVLDLPNIFYLGLKPYTDLFNYVWRFDIAIIPFIVNEITLATSPVKLFEYMACHKPVVVTNLPECRSYSQIFLAKDNDQFADYVSEALQKKGDNTYQMQLDQLAQANTWEVRIQKIISPMLTKM